MAFTIKLYAEDTTTYVPDFRGNRELAEAWNEEGEKPFFSVELLPLSGRDLNKANGQAFRKVRGGHDLMRGAERLVQRIMSEYVPRVMDLSLETGPGAWVKPTDGAALYTAITRGVPGYGDIIDDIYEALKDNSRADEGDLKKLRPRSVSSTPDPSLRDVAGDVRDARGGVKTPGRVPEMTATTSGTVTYTESPETATD